MSHFCLKLTKCCMYENEAVKIIVSKSGFKSKYILRAAIYININIHTCDIRDRKRRINCFFHHKDIVRSVSAILYAVPCTL